MKKALVIAIPLMLATGCDDWDTPSAKTTTHVVVHTTAAPRTTLKPPAQVKPKPQRITPPRVQTRKRP